MFWHYVFNNNSAHIEKLLEKEDVTLRELMDEDELLQECQAQNKKLIDFLSTNSVLQELVSLVVTEPSNELEYQIRFKHSSLAAELLTAEVPSIVDKLAASEELLNTLCNFLLNEKPLNPLLASFFSKVLGMLMHRRAEQNWYQYQVTCFRVLDFLKSSPDFVPKIVHHIGTSAIMNLLHKLMCGIEEEEIRNRIHMWLRETPLMSLLVAKLAPENDWCEQASTDQLICDLLDCSANNNMMLPGQGIMSAAAGMIMGINNGANGSSDNIGSQGQSTNMLLPHLMNECTVHQLVNILLNDQSTSSSTTHVTNVLIRMLTRQSCNLCGVTTHDANITGGAAPSNPQNSDTSLDDAPPSSTSSRSSLSDDITHFCVAQSLADALPQIHNMLLKSNTELIETSFGVKTERLGATRLRLIALIAALIETKHIKIHQMLANLQTIPLILDLFFKFSQNNFLHTLVQQCVLGLLTQANPGASSSSTSSTPPPHLSSPSQPQTNPPQNNTEEVEAMDTSNPPANITDIKTDNIPSNTNDASSPVVVATGAGSGVITDITSTDSSNSSSLVPNNNIVGDATNDSTATDAQLNNAQESCKMESSLQSCSQKTSPGSALLYQLFNECFFIQRILACYQYDFCKDTLSIPEGSLCGYKGHIRLMANVLSEQSVNGPNKNILTALIESLPSDVQTAWREFVSTKLPEVNTINAFIAPNDDMNQMSDDDLKTSSDIINAMNYSLSFEDNGFSNTENTGIDSEADAGKSLADTISSPVEDKESKEIFEKMCSTNFLRQFKDLNSVWDNNEKCITYTKESTSNAASKDHSEDSNEEKKDDDVDDRHSSDEETTDEPTDPSMEVDEQDSDWGTVFDRRVGGFQHPPNSCPSNPVTVEAFNPWSNAGTISNISSDPSEASTPPVQQDSTWASFSFNNFNCTSGGIVNALPFEASNNSAFGTFDAFQNTTDTTNDSIRPQFSLFNAFHSSDANTDSNQAQLQSPTFNAFHNTDASGDSNQSIPFNAFQNPDSSSESIHIEQQGPSSSKTTSNTNPFTADFTNLCEQQSDSNITDQPTNSGEEKSVMEENMPLRKEVESSSPNNKEVKATSESSSDESNKPTTKF